MNATLELVAIGDVYMIDGRPFEVVDEHDGSFTLDNDGEQHHLTTKQLEALPRVRVASDLLKPGE